MLRKMLSSQLSLLYKLNSQNIAADRYSINLLRMTIAASYLDSLFSSVEGSPNLRIHSRDSFFEMEDKVIAESKIQQQKRGRYTKRGLMTDDSQLLLSGLMAKVKSNSAPGGFTNEYLNMWREFYTTGTWRNTGPRMKSFFNTKESQLNLGGEFTTGDMLRALPFLYAGNSFERIASEFYFYAQKLKLTEGQMFSSLEFIYAAHAMLNGNGAKAEAHLAALQEMNQNDRQLYSVIKALKNLASEKWSFTEYLEFTSKVTKDYDTIAFLGGIFARDIFELVVMQSGLNIHEDAYLRFLDMSSVLLVGDSKNASTEAHAYENLYEYIQAERKMNDYLTDVRLGKLEPTDL